jgi:hypothetical protein
MNIIRKLTSATIAAMIMLPAAQAGAASGADAPGGGLGLKAPRPPSQENALAALYPASRPTTTFYLGERNMPRLGTQGTESYGGISHALAPSWTSSVEAGVTHEPSLFAPQYSLSGRIERRLAPGQAVSLGLKMSSFDRSGRAAYGPGLPGFVGEPFPDATGYEVNMSYFYGNGNRVGMYYQLAPAPGGYAGLTPGLGANTLMFSSEHQLSPKWALSYDLSAPEPGAILRTPSLGLGLRYRF